MARSVLGPSVAHVVGQARSTGNLAILFRETCPTVCDSTVERFIRDGRTIRWVPGQFSLTDFVALRRCFPLSRVRYKTREMSLLELLPVLQRGVEVVTFEILDVCLTPPRALECKHDLQVMLARPVAIQLFYKLSLTELVHMLRAVRLFSAARTRVVLRGRLYDVIRKRFSVDLKIRPVLRVPYHPCVPRSRLNRLVDCLIQDLPLCGAARDWLRARTRVVFTQRESVGKLLHNYRAFAKEVTTVAPKCPCRLFRGRLPMVDGHVACRTSELVDSEWAPLAQSSKNVPVPTATDHSAEF